MWKRIGLAVVAAFMLASCTALEGFAQLIPRPPIPRRRPAGQPRPNFTYERPAISPWVGVDWGLAVPVARCEQCDDAVHGGFAFMGSVAAGATFFSRVTIAAERTGMGVLFFESGSGAQLTMLTARAGLQRGAFGLLARAGYGESRFKQYPSTLLVDDRPTWLVGVEACGLTRVDLCVFVDNSWSGLGSPAPSGLGEARYRLRAFRVGTALRLHFLPGRRIPYPSHGS